MMRWTLGCLAALAAVLSPVAATAQIMDDAPRPAAIDPAWMADYAPPAMSGKPMRKCDIFKDRGPCVGALDFGNYNDVAGRHLDAIGAVPKRHDDLMVVHYRKRLTKEKLNGSHMEAIAELLLAQHRFGEALVELNRGLKTWYSSSTMLAMRSDLFRLLGRNDLAATDNKAAIYWAEASGACVACDSYEFLLYRRAGYYDLADKTAEAQADLKTMIAGSEDSNPFTKAAKTQLAELAKGRGGARSAMVRDQFARPACITDIAAWQSDAAGLGFEQGTIEIARNRILLACGRFDQVRREQTPRVEQAMLRPAPLSPFDLALSQVVLDSYVKQDRPLDGARWLASQLHARDGIATDQASRGDIFVRLFKPMIAAFHKAGAYAEGFDTLRDFKRDYPHQLYLEGRDLKREAQLANQPVSAEGLAWLSEIETASYALSAKTYKAYRDEQDRIAWAKWEAERPAREAEERRIASERQLAMSRARSISPYLSQLRGCDAEYNDAYFWVKNSSAGFNRSALDRLKNECMAILIKARVEYPSEPTFSSYRFAWED